MPFAIIETINAKGNRELSVVPNSWLRGSPGGSIVLWPNVSPAEQEKYLCDENSCPDSSWLRYECTVKRNLIGSYNHAFSLMDSLGAEDVPSKKSRYERKSQNFLQELVCNTGSSLTEHNNSATQSKAGSAGGKFPVITEAYSTSNSETVQLVSDDEADHVEAEDPIQKCLDKMDIIIGMQQQINQRLDLLEKRVTGISRQNYGILEATKLQGCRIKSDIEETLSFNFNPMESDEELVQLEKNLEDKEFNAKLVSAQDTTLCFIVQRIQYIY